MRKNLHQNLLTPIVTLCVFCLALAVLVLLRIPCPFRTLTEIPCPGCGLSRAWRAALRLDLESAFTYHPLFWSVPVIMVLVAFWGRLFRKKWLHSVFLGLLIAVWAVCYCLRLAAMAG